MKIIKKIYFMLLIILFSFNCVNANTINISASSFLKEKGKVYPPSNIIDKNLNTTWAFRYKNKKEKPELIIKLKKSENIQSLSIVNGFAKSRNLYYANSRLKKIQIFLISKNKKRDFYIELKDVFNVQHFQITNNFKINKIKIKVMEIYKGEKYNDLCLTELLINNIKKANSFYYIERIFNAFEKNKIDQEAFDLLAKNYNNMELDINNFFSYEREYPIKFLNLILMLASYNLTNIDRSESLLESIYTYIDKTPKMFFKILRKVAIKYDKVKSIYDVMYESLDYFYSTYTNADNETKNIIISLINEYISKGTDRQLQQYLKNYKNRFIKKFK